MPVILATQRHRPGGLQFETSLGKQFARPYLKNTQHKTGLADWLKCRGLPSKCEALSSNPSITKNKKKKIQLKVQEFKYSIFSSLYTQ
jgi:hypothetical protein